MCESKWYWQVSTILLLVILTLCQSVLAADSGITFEEVSQKFGSEGQLTDLQKKEAWKKYQGQCVEWSGELVYVSEGVFGGISIGFKNLPKTLTYDVLVSAPAASRDMALRMEKGKYYTYRVTLRNYGGAFLPMSADWGCR